MLKSSMVRGSPAVAVTVEVLCVGTCAHSSATLGAAMSGASTFSHLYVLLFPSRSLSLSDWMVRTGKPFVFLSNTGAKGSPGVQKKFMSEKYKLCDYPVPLRHIRTVSACEYPNR